MRLFKSDSTINSRKSFRIIVDFLIDLYLIIILYYYVVVLWL